MFGIADYGAFCVAILIFLALPGPGTLALLGATGQGGLRAGAAATAGLIAGDQVLLWLAVAGVAALLKAHPAAFAALQWLGAAYLGWIGLQLIFQRAGAAGPVRITAGRYFRQAWLITVLNPKAIVFYMAFFPLFVDPARHRGWLTFAVMALTIAVLTAVYCLALVSMAGAVRAQVLAHQRLARGLRRLAGVALLGFGLRLAVQ